MSLVRYLIDKIFSYVDGVSLYELPVLPYEITKVDNLKSIVVSSNGKLFAIHTGNEVEVWCTLKRVLRTKAELGPSFENPIIDLNDDGTLLVSNAYKTICISSGVTEDIDSKYLARWIDSNTMLNFEKDGDSTAISIRKMPRAPLEIGFKLRDVTIIDAYVISRNELCLYLLDDSYGKVVYVINLQDLQLTVYPLSDKNVGNLPMTAHPKNYPWCLPVLNALNPDKYPLIWTAKEGKNKLMEGKNVNFTKNEEKVIFFHTSGLMGYNPKCNGVLITSNTGEDGKIMVSANLSKNFVLSNA